MNELAQSVGFVDVYDLLIVVGGVVGLFAGLAYLVCSDVMSG